MLRGLISKIFKIASILTLTTSCINRDSVDIKTNFLKYIDKIQEPNIQFNDSFTVEQKDAIYRNKLGVYVPTNFKSIVDINDREAFIFYNPIDTSLLLARCFNMTDSIYKQIQNSAKFDSPIYGPDYNDLSEFEHFKSCERIITNTPIGPLLFGGSFYNLLGADYVMHQNFTPKSKRYKFGEIKLMFDRKKYLIVVSLHNGYFEDLNGHPRWQTFTFNNE